MQAPSHNPVTLVFGATTDPYSAANPHKGVDFAYLPDSTIYMPCDAVITQKPNNGADGNGTYFTAPDGTFQGLLHADHYLVPNGASVKEGQPVAVMGDTGFAQGKHLHWAVMKDGKYIDPLTLLSGGSGGEPVTIPEGQINDEDDIAELWRMSFFRDPTPQEIQDNKSLIGKYWSDAARWIRSTEAFQSVKAQYEIAPKLQKQVDDLTKQLASQGTTLKPGKYVVQ